MIQEQFFLQKDLLYQQSHSNNNNSSIIASNNNSNNNLQIATTKYACVLCYKRFRFEELTSDLMVCKPCSQILVLVKCHYCRVEFERNIQRNKSKPILCDQCNDLRRSHGEPNCCEICQLVAAFNNQTKCNRCIESERIYGSPGICEQCKRKCSFTGNNPSAREKVGGQQLCWICTVSYKRVLNKFGNSSGGNQNQSSSSSSLTISNNKSSNKKTATTSAKSINHNHRHKSLLNLVSSTSLSSSNILKQTSHLLPGKPAIQRTVQSTSLQNFTLSSDKVAEVAQLREKILSLEKQLDSKNQDSYMKEMQIQKLESDIEREQQASRELIQETQRKNNERILELQQKIDSLVSQMTLVKRK